MRARAAAEMQKRGGGGLGGSEVMRCTWGDAGRCREMQGDAVRYREMQGGSEVMRCTWGDAGRNKKLPLPRP